MLHSVPQIGDVIVFRPSAFDRDPKLADRVRFFIPASLRGVVIHVNAEHRHYTLEAHLRNETIRETFKF